MVAANDALLTLVGLDPLTAVVSVTEADYAAVQAGQAASLQVDALPGRTFPAEVARIAPVFDPASRLARIELSVPNAEGILKPGMFARITLVLGSEPSATVVPAEALVLQDGETGIFLVSGDVAAWRPVVVGMRQGGRVQVRGEGLDGQQRVVVLGQSLLRDGAPLSIMPAPAPAP